MKIKQLLFIFFIVSKSAFSQAPTVQITKEQSDKGMEEYAANVGQQTYLYGLPMVLNYRWANVMRSIIKKTEDPNSKFKFEKFDGELTYNKWINAIGLPTHDLQTTTTPNDDTIYSVFFADLRNDAIVISLPAIKDRYFSIALGDAFLENTDYISTRMGDLNGGNYLLVGPDFKGQIPTGKFKKVFKMRHNVFVFISRIQVRNPKEDLQKAVKLELQLKSESLSKYLNKTKIDKFGTVEVFPNPTKALDWYAYLFEKLKVNRPLAADNAIVKSWLNLGLAIDKTNDFNALAEPIKKGLERGFEEGKEVLQWYTNIGPKRSKNNWFLSFERGAPQQNYLFRAYYSIIGMYTNLKEEAIYPQTILDGNGEKLTGKYSYKLTIPKEKLKASKSFWSIIAYQGSDFVPNKYYHYSVGNDKEFPVKYNEDGSLTIIFSHEPPNGNLGNWLATPADGIDFRVVYRMYIPYSNLLNSEGIDSYLPPIEKINE